MVCFYHSAGRIESAGRNGPENRMPPLATASERMKDLP